VNHISILTFLGHLVPLVVLAVIVVLIAARLVCRALPTVSLPRRRLPRKRRPPLRVIKSSAMDRELAELLRAEKRREDRS
jgi:hypothetical protein